MKNELRVIKPKGLNIFKYNMDITKFEVKCKDCEEIVSPEPIKHKRKYQFLMLFVFGMIGFGIGGTIGIATAGMGIAATLPLTIIGAYIGYKIGGWIAKIFGNITCPKCDYKF